MVRIRIVAIGQVNRGAAVDCDAGGKRQCRRGRGAVEGEAFYSRARDRADDSSAIGPMRTRWLYVSAM